MKCTPILLVLALLCATACDRNQTQQANVPSSQPPVKSIPCETAIATQNRINRYFHNAVLPKMKSCWDGLKGGGTIAIEFNYRRGENGWATEGMRVQKSTLPEGQETIALQCLQDSVRGTSFPVEEADGLAKEFFVNWSWPVPLPKDVNEAAQRMISTGGGRNGGCGGSEGPAPACQDCATPYIPFVGPIAFCTPACVGYKNCTRIPDPPGCKMDPIQPRCVTGSLYGNVGGIVMY